MNRLNLTNTLKDEFSNKVYRNLATELASPKWKKKKKSLQRRLKHGF